MSLPLQPQRMHNEVVDFMEDSLRLTEFAQNRAFPGSDREYGST
jgi:hypothetical protein